MSKASAAIVLSRFEAFTMVVGEAASIGCPLIISNRTGWNNLIDKFNAGLFVNPYKINEVANAMKDMENNEIAKKYAENITRLNEYLSSDALISLTVNAYLI